MQPLRQLQNSVLMLVLLVLASAPLCLLALNPATSDDRTRECAVAVSVARWYLGDARPAYVPTSVWIGGAHDRQLDCQDDLLRAGLLVSRRDDAFFRGLMLSRVRFERNGTAVVQCAHGSGALGGYGTRVVLRERSGRWIVVAEQGTWIS